MSKLTIEKEKIRFPIQVIAGKHATLCMQNDRQVVHRKPVVHTNYFFVRPDYESSIATFSVSVEPSTVYWPTGVSVILSCMDVPRATFGIAHPAIIDRGSENLAKRNLLSLEGGYLSAEEFAKSLNISTSLLSDIRKDGKIIGIDTVNGAPVFPMWQLERGKLLPGLDKVLQTLNDFDPWMKLSFMVRPNAALEMRSPLQALRSGDINAVNRAAKLYGEQGSI